MHRSAIRRLFDVAIVGGGIVGCAVARQLKIAKPNLSVVLLEKECRLAAHQSGHNSGVLHAGIYYAPGSLKAKLCVSGIDLAYKYLEDNEIAHKKCGKLIVALDEAEIRRLEALFDRAKQNQCKGIEMIGEDGIRQIEPHCRGLKAIWSPYTGIVDWTMVTRKFAEDFQRMGGTVFCDWSLEGIGPSGDSAHPLRLIGAPNGAQIIDSKFLITCAGLFSDRVARLSGCPKLPKIVPFRGEYLKLKPERRFLIKNANIYPVPDPRFPFLGVHFTPTIHGEVLLGPNAVLAFGREAYGKSEFSFKDFADVLSFRGMWKLMGRHWAAGIGEFYRSVFVSAQVKLLQRYVPELRSEDVERGLAGIRAQAMDAEGNLVDDFVFDSGEGPLAKRMLHVRNAPSPGATSSMAIAQMIVEKSTEKFGI
ncbi:hypothetical protein niasHT_013504 [Heterodera trifolii]|uniref:L-2-hydroxyglutarate dehydrogenase, mitochondrial n=1 Tax=Heterodera trifolii TaxID=157864 RepID=A0ABD2LCV8_9BILA